MSHQHTNGYFFTLLYFIVLKRVSCFVLVLFFHLYLLSAVLTEADLEEAKASLLRLRDEAGHSYAIIGFTDCLPELLAAVRRHVPGYALKEPDLERSLPQYGRGTARGLGVSEESRSFVASQNSMDNALYRWARATFIEARCASDLDLEIPVGTKNSFHGNASPGSRRIGTGSKAARESARSHAESTSDSSSYRIKVDTGMELVDDTVDGSLGSSDEILKVNWTVHSRHSTPLVDLYVCPSPQLDVDKCTAIVKSLPNGLNGRGAVTLHVITPFSRHGYAEEYEEAREAVRGVIQRGGALKSVIEPSITEEPLPSVLW